MTFLARKLLYLPYIFFNYRYFFIKQWQGDWRGQQVEKNSQSRKEKEAKHYYNFLKVIMEIIFFKNIQSLIAVFF